MHKPLFALAFLVVCCWFVPAASAGEGFGLPSLNPFAAKKKPAGGKITDDVGPAAAPSIGSTVERKPPPQPSTLQKMGAGTKSFFTTSKNVLMPWSKSKQPKPPAQVTGTKKVYSGSATSTKKAPVKKSMFGSMFGGSEEKPKEPESIGDFLGQPRPGF